MAVTTVVFDLGETLLDETEMWGGVADRIGVTRLTLSAMLGAMIELGKDAAGDELPGAFDD